MLHPNAKGAPTAEPTDHPIRLRVSDDLERSRLTVFFRLLLALPHLIWLTLWTIAAVFAAIVAWFATLFSGRAPDGLHSFLAAWVRYQTHVFAFLYLAANPFPGFTGTPGSYPVDVEIDPPQRQNRWVTGFRIVLVIPALMLSSALSGGSGGGGGGAGGAYAGGLAATLAFLGWFVCLVRARQAHGFRDALVYSVGYGARVTGYLFLLTDRYPNTDPGTFPVLAADDRDRPVRLRREDDLYRSRLTVFFRLLLAIPHFVWWYLWGAVALFALIGNWFATLFSGRSPDALHRFLGAYVRYQAHVVAYAALISNPFPGFLGRPGTYPVEIEINEPRPQNRWVTGFRIVLVLPAVVIAAAFVGVVFAVALLAWFAALATGRMPRGLGNLGGYALGYLARLNGYLNLLTDRYPYTGPSRPEEASPAPPERVPA